MVDWRYGSGAVKWLCGCTYLRSGLVGLQLVDVKVLDKVYVISSPYISNVRTSLPFFETAETAKDLEKVGATRRA